MVAPSGPVDGERARAGVALLSSWGLDVQFAPHALSRHDRLSYLSADDDARAEDFTQAWTDPAVRAVWAARGGYGVQRMVDRIDFDALRAAGPKHLIGFSDITALHSRIGRELDQVTVHGPVAGSVAQLSDAATRQQLHTAIMERPRSGLGLCEGTPVIDGAVEGVLVGGNLSLLAADVGIEPPPTRPSILLVEDIDERGYRVDRMLTQLRRSGWLDGVVGLVVGTLSDPDDACLVDRVVIDRLAELGRPMIIGAGVGHGLRNLALPLGAAVALAGSLASGRGSLTLR